MRWILSLPPMQTIVISYMSILSLRPEAHEVYHIERRLAERDRSVTVHSRSSMDLFELGSSWNARSTAHEYRGRAATGDRAR